MKKKTSETNVSIKILIANVFQDNRDTEKCKAIIRRCNPDIFLLVEVDEHWAKGIEEFKKDYPYSIVKPQSNTYGILLYSKFEILTHTVRYLVDPDVPSISADIKTEQGTFRLYGLHPKPPVPNESEDSTERDAEILIIGREAKACKLPVIVAGDLNDVAWSDTTRLFLKASELLDPRRGRGFYSTFHAKYWLFRWPLDHVFCSSHFLLDKLERLSSIGSDHFPIYIKVALMPEKVKENEDDEKHADAEDEKEVRETIAEAK